MRFIYEVTWTQASKDPKARPKKQTMRFTTQDVAMYNAAILQHDKHAENVQVNKIPRL